MQNTLDDWRIDDLRCWKAIISFFKRNYSLHICVVSFYSMCRTSGRPGQRSGKKKKRGANDPIQVRHLPVLMSLVLKKVGSDIGRS